MATLNLGRIKPVFQGAYNGSTAYVVDDIVTFGDETFICIQASTGNATSNASYWTKLAAKGTDGTDVGTTLTTQGDILYRDGSGLQRLAAGTNGQALLTGGAGANPSWGDAGGIISSQQKTINTRSTISTTTFTNVFNTTMDIVVTPNSTSSKFLLMWNGAYYGQYLQSDIARDIGGAGYNRLSGETNGMGGMYGNASTWKSGCNIFIDAPNTTSQVTYRPYGRKTSSADALFGDGGDIHIFSMLEFKG